MQATTHTPSLSTRLPRVLVVGGAGYIGSHLVKHLLHAGCGVTINGAGKSTLLKILAKISTPTRGSVKVICRIAPLTEVGASFVPDFTGRENVYINATILGMSRQEINKKLDEIVDFSEMSAHLTPCHNVPHEVH